MGRLRSASLAVLVLALGAPACKKSEAAPLETRELFVRACSRCHGTEGTGGVAAYDGGPAPRNFRDHEFQASRTDEQLKMTIRDGKGTGMPPFGTTFDDAQLTALVRQIRSFDPERR